MYSQHSENIKCFCTFSRVTPEKGIDEAIEAISLANKRGVKCHLDIWGPIERGFEDHYATIFNNNEAISYCGVLATDEGLDKLSGYYMMLFPSFYPGEGFPTTICEGFMTGLPVIASDWRFNSELIKDGETGYLFPVHDVEKLTELIITAVENENSILLMKKNAMEYSKAFEPQNVMRNLSSWIREMKKIGFIGYFGYSVRDPIIGGQMSKTIGIYNELIKEYGEEQIARIDTSNWKAEKFKLLHGIIKICRTCDPIIVMPNKKGIKLILPIVSIFKNRYKYSIAYPIVGGWLPEILEKNKYLIKHLRKMDYLLPETKTLEKEIRKYYGGKIDVMPIFSSRAPVNENSEKEYCRKPLTEQ